MKRITSLVAVLVAALSITAASAQAADGLVPNGGFEKGFTGWTLWGKNAKLITLESASAHSGTNSARIQKGFNALYFTTPLTPGKAYELRFFYRLGGANPSGQVALNFARKGGPLRSAGSETFKTEPSSAGDAGAWTEFRKVFLPSPSTASCQFAFTAGDGSTFWIDDVSLKEVPRPAGLTAPPEPWAGMAHRTAQPLFKELLTPEPGGYTVVSWLHDLNPKGRNGYKSEELKDPAKWQKEVQTIFKETGEAGMGFLDLPGRLDGAEPWRTAEFHREQFRKHGVRYDVWSEGSGSAAAALKNGAELLNPSAKALGARPSASVVDPAYIEAQSRILRRLGEQLRGQPFVGYYYGRDEASVHLPEGNPDTWGSYGKAMAKEVLESYGFGRFAAPLPKDKDFLNDPHKWFRWIAYNRWMNDKFIESRCRLRLALREADPDARYSPLNYWFMSGFVPYDHSRLAACSDLMELDPYASSAERNRGRGVYNHGFGAKFMSDLGGKPVRIIAQAFDYAGYDMEPEDLREWVSQAMRCGASAIDYYEMDSPRWTHPDRWQMMLHLSSIITRMNRIALPKDPDTAILFALYTHMSQGPSTGGDQVYAAHALVGELAGSWFKFVSDAQLERREKNLSGFKAVYLPLAKYMTPEATKQIEHYVRAGGVLICGDAESFAFDLAGNDTSAARERILGVKTAGPKKADQIVLKSARWGLPAGASLKLFDLKLWDKNSPGQAREISLVDAAAEILATYPDSSPAIIAHKLGKGSVVTFATNPFAPQVTVDESLWPAAFKGLQQSLGCKVDRSIWRFALPPTVNSPP